jgi:hypothetical protein
MPSRNSINKPKLSGKPGKRVKLISSAPKPSGVVYKGGVPKKRAQKDVRNAKYVAQRLNGEDVDMDKLSVTQAKHLQRKQKLERRKAINLVLVADKPALKMQMSFGSGKGTTLGKPKKL